MEEKKDVRVCKRCLLKEFNEKDYYDRLHKYIVSLDQKTRVSDEVYEKRLSICKQCDKLSEGTCLGCGCYVELRAVVKSSHCPYKNW